MHEMKIETTRILEPALSPYHTGKSVLKTINTVVDIEAYEITAHFSSLRHYTV